ncbi:hypothetical protein StoSoilB13_49030 (plasmid) [Arthrobacter sp. StoSoilB13]|nr:hypothetical protein StoSoilB13_49030 [Arthrobacter sp. StoSoilB13]
MAHLEELQCGFFLAGPSVATCTLGSGHKTVGTIDITEKGLQYSEQVPLEMKLLAVMPASTDK